MIILLSFTCNFFLRRNSKTKLNNWIQRIRFFLFRKERRAVLREHYIWTGPSYGRTRPRRDRANRQGRREMSWMSNVYDPIPLRGGSIARRFRSLTELSHPVAEVTSLSAREIDSQWRWRCFQRKQHVRTFPRALSRSSGRSLSAATISDELLAPLQTPCSLPGNLTDCWFRSTFFAPAGRSPANPFIIAAGSRGMLDGTEMAPARRKVADQLGILIILLANEISRCFLPLVTRLKDWEESLRTPPGHSYLQFSWHWSVCFSSV